MGQSNRRYVYVLNNCIQDNFPNFICRHETACIKVSSNYDY